MEAANKAPIWRSPSIGLNIQLLTNSTAMSTRISARPFAIFCAKIYVRQVRQCIRRLTGWIRTLDELMEALTLVQTGKTRKMPIILVCSDFGAA